MTLKPLFAPLALLFAFLYVAPLPAGDIQEIIARKRLVVAMLGVDIAPFVMTSKDGSLYGYDVDIAKGVAKELGVELKIDRSSKTFNGLVDKVSSNEADMALSMLSRSLDRSKKVIFTEPYLVVRKALMINRLELARRKGRLPVEEYIKKLDGSVGVISGSVYEEFAKEMFPNAKLRSYSSWDAVAENVFKEKVFCGFIDDLEVKRSMRSVPSSSIRFATIVFRDSEDSIAIAVGADRMQFRYWLNEYIDERKIKTDADSLIQMYPEEAVSHSINIKLPTVALQ